MAISQFPSKGGIPSGNTASRPGSPVIGDTYYNGQLELLEIYNGTEWVASSAPSGIPTITVVDVGTNIAYGSAQGVITIAENEFGGKPIGFNISASTGGYTATTTGTTVNIIVGNNGSYTFSGKSYNLFGESLASPSVTETLTTVPQAPTIGTATASGSVSEVTVTWTLGSNGGKNLSAITITPYLNGTTAETSRTAATTSSTTYTFTSGQLTAGSSYTFKVSATNANGTGLQSAASNSATPPQLIGIEYLVIAGGAGGGMGNSSNYSGGGGGAGGYRTSTRNVLPSTNYTVTVGAGGATRTTQGTGNAGSNSTFANITSTGGGGGGSSGSSAASGGSGGGSAGVTTAGGTGNAGGFTPSEGNDGGAQTSSNNEGAGGGGAGSVGGVRPTTSAGGNGGSGASSSITGTAVTRAGGGGGGGNPPGTGGSGGGGAGANYNIAPYLGTNGTANTGGGGGGAGSGASSSSGGSGIVILRYLTADGTITIGAGLTGSTATDGSYKVTTITAGSGNVSWA